VTGFGARIDKLLKNQRAVTWEADALSIWGSPTFYGRRPKTAPPRGVGRCNNPGAYPAGNRDWRVHLRVYREEGRRQGVPALLGVRKGIWASLGLWDPL